MGSLKTRVTVAFYEQDRNLQVLKLLRRNSLGMGIRVVSTKDLEAQHWFGLTTSVLGKGFDFSDLLVPNLQSSREVGDSMRSLEINITGRRFSVPRSFAKATVVLYPCIPGFVFLLLPQQSMSCARHLLPVPITGCPWPSGGWLLNAQEKRALE